jgi:hypothetical protein
MEVKSRTHLKYLTFDEQPCCPFLGVKNGLYAHVGYACNSNYCHRVIPAETIGFSHQEQYCLTENYTGCQIYREPAQSQALRDAAPVELLERERDITNTPSVSNSVEDWSDDIHKKRHRNRFVLIFAIILIVLVMGGISAFVFINKSQQAEYNAALVAQKTQLATAVYDAVQAKYAMSAADTTKIPTVAATSVVESLVQPTAFPTVHITEALTNPAPTATPITTTVQNNTLLAENVCESLEGYRFEVISGPLLTPGLGYRYVLGKAPPAVRATWIIKNTSQCSFDKITIFSPFNAKTLDPIFFKDGKPLHLEDFNGKPVLDPGGEIEIGLDFSAQNSRNIRDEWVLVVNDRALAVQPHLSLDVQDWVITYAAEVNPTKVPKPNNESKKRNNNQLNATEPPASPTEHVPNR